jgi:hypothetical protein
MYEIGKAHVPQSAAFVTLFSTEKLAGLGIDRTDLVELGPPVGWPVEYRVGGPDVNEVRDIALRLAQIVASDFRARRI